MNRLKTHYRLVFLGIAFIAFGSESLAQSRVLPDPTKPPVVAGDNTGTSAGGQPSSDGAKLMAVFIQPSNRSVVINNDTVVEGQIWNGMQVLAIYPQKVVLKNESGTQELVLNDVIIKRDAQNEF